MIIFIMADGSKLNEVQMIALWKLELKRIEGEIQMGRADEAYGYNRTHREMYSDLMCQIASRERSLKRQADRHRQLQRKYQRD